MNLLDMVELGFDNLRRTKLRTALTTLGVIIGIGALTSMVSFGTGMQKNITETFEENDLFTSLFVTAADVEEMAQADPDQVRDLIEETPAPLTDQTLGAIREVEGVEIAFPELRFPVRIEIGGEETRTLLRALPAVMGSYKPFSETAYGEFYTDDGSEEVVVRWQTLESMGILVEEEPSGTAEKDTTGETRSVHPDSILGTPIVVVSTTLDVSRIPTNPMQAFSLARDVPVKEVTTELTIGGIMKRSSAFGSNTWNAGVLVPMETARQIPSLGFASIWEILRKQGRGDSYASIYVRVEDVGRVEAVRDSLESMGLNVFSIADQLEDIKKGFMIMDAVLGAVGTIALVVAALGIINTMVMSILERRREIGVMKAIGGSENDIKMIFVVEAGSIGFVGAILGLVLGWVVTIVANFVANSYLLPDEAPFVNFFHFPVWLILGAVAFSIVVSLAAGLYPAIRAASVDPVTALRHD
jgi:putative ABC transport system permease protein